MKGFTLIEVALVLFISFLIFGITISFNTFNKDFFYLQNVAKKFSFALNIVSDLSQRITGINNQFYCAYGIYFPNSTSFEALAFATTTKLCDEIIATSSVGNFINFNLTNKTYILQNQDLVTTIIPALSLNTTLNTGYRIVFSNTTTCISNYNSPLIFMYVYSYNDLFFIFQQGVNWQKINVNEIYVCLEKPGKESYIIKLNKLGQLSIIK